MINKTIIGLAGILFIAAGGIFAYKLLNFKQQLDIFYPKQQASVEEKIEPRVRQPLPMPDEVSVIEPPAPMNNEEPVQAIKTAADDEPIVRKKRSRKEESKSLDVTQKEPVVKRKREIASVEEKKPTKSWFPWKNKTEEVVEKKPQKRIARVQTEDTPTVKEKIKKIFTNKPQEQAKPRSWANEELNGYKNGSSKVFSDRDR